MSKRIPKKSTIFRIELELRSRFLRLNEIKDPYDFQKLVEILPGRHMYFARFNEKKLSKRLLGMGFTPKRVWEILEEVWLLDGDVWATLNYLRQELELKNTRRFLDPLETNDVVLDALRVWGEMWPAAPTKLQIKGGDQ